MSNPQTKATPLKHELALLQGLVVRHKRDLAALIGDADDRRMTRAAGELGAAVESMEKGAETILKSTESIDDSARALSATLTTDYERGLAQDIQDHTVRIFEACNFQDLAGQRIGKVIATLNEVEDLLVQMLARCDGAPRIVDRGSPCPRRRPAERAKAGRRCRPRQPARHRRDVRLSCVMRAAGSR